jgi:hypothetical protein
MDTAASLQLIGLPNNQIHQFERWLGIKPLHLCGYIYICSRPTIIIFFTVWDELNAHDDNLVDSSTHPTIPFYGE